MSQDNIDESINTTPVLHGRVKMSLLLIFSITCYLAYLLLCQVSFAQESGTVLKGTIKEQNYLPGGKTPSLNLRDVNKKRDAFGNNEVPSLPSVGETFEPPEGAFGFGGKQPPIKGNVDQTSTFGPQDISQPANPDFNVEQPVPGLDESAGGVPPFQVSATTNADPDNTPELQLAWDQWHRRVAAAIYGKFNALAQMAFKYSHPLACYITYTVTRDGQVINAQLQQKSNNVAFNAMVIVVVNSMSGQTDLLAFPSGSRRTSVNKAGMFTQNYGVQGFKYTTGDREIIPAH
jgi:hypothetical protein